MVNQSLGNKQIRFVTSITSTNANDYGINETRISVGNPAEWSNLPTTLEYGCLISMPCGAYVLQFYKSENNLWSRIYADGWKTWRIN